MRESRDTHKYGEGVVKLPQAEELSDSLSDGVWGGRNITLLGDGVVKRLLEVADVQEVITHVTQERYRVSFVGEAGSEQSLTRGVWPSFLMKYHWDFISSLIRLRVLFEAGAFHLKERRAAHCVCHIPCSFSCYWYTLGALP